MKQAIDLDTGRLVDADEVSEWGLGAFKCHCCFDSVQLISPAAIASYFRHLHATYPTDCENYRVGAGGGSSQGGSGEGRWLALFVVPLITPRTRSWRLELFIPDPGPILQAARYNDARGEQTLSSFTSARGGRRIQVLPQDKDYRVDFGQKSSSSSRRLEIPGLQRQFANAFHFGDAAGRRLGTGEPLVLGESYVIICHSSAKLSHLDQVGTLAIGQNEQWLGSIVTLPTEKSNQLQSWCYRQFRRDVIPPGPKLSLTFPPSAVMLDDGTWAISNERDEIYLACSGPAGSETPDHVGWKYRYADRPSWLQLRGSLPVFFLLPSQYKSWYEVLLRDHTRGALELLVGEQTSLTHPAGVRLATRTGPGGVPRAVSLLSPEATSQLQAVREGNEELVSITLPAELPLQIRVKGPTERLWRPLGDGTDQPGLAPGANEGNSSESLLIDRLKSAISQRELSVRIDAGNFGFVELVGAAVLAGQAKQVAIPDRLRQRFIWLLTTLSSSGATTDVMTQPLGLHPLDDVDWDRISQRDRPLIQKFIRVRCWPVAFVAHARVAVREFSQLIR